MARLAKNVSLAIFFHSSSFIPGILESLIFREFQEGLMGFSSIFVGENQNAIDSLLRFGYIYVAIN